MRHIVVTLPSGEEVYWPHLCNNWHDIEKIYGSADCFQDRQVEMIRPMLLACITKMQRAGVRIIKPMVGFEFHRGFRYGTHNWCGRELRDDNIYERAEALLYIYSRWASDLTFIDPTATWRSDSETPYYSRDQLPPHMLNAISNIPDCIKEEPESESEIDSDDI